MVPDAVQPDKSPVSKLGLLRGAAANTWLGPIATRGIALRSVPISRSATALLNFEIKFILFKVDFSFPDVIDRLHIQAYG
jgi:hypothetical protein